jgi:hypothetical protein
VDKKEPVGSLEGRTVKKEEDKGDDDDGKENKDPDEGKEVDEATEKLGKARLEDVKE